VHAAAHTPPPQTWPALHSSSPMQFLQSCCSVQTPLAQFEPSALQPGAQVFVSVQY
jgi:hypothetical protein